MMQHITNSFPQKSYIVHRYQCLCPCNRWTHFYYINVCITWK